MTDALFMIVDNRGGLTPQVYVDLAMPRQEAQEMLDDFLRYAKPEWHARLSLMPAEDAAKLTRTGKAQIGIPKKKRAA